MDKPELVALKEELLASCEGFNRKDAAAWLDPLHADAITYNRGFVPVSAVRPIADAVLSASKSFNVDNVDGRIVGDTAILFGDYRYELADGNVEAGAFTITYARVDSGWKGHLSHYTPS